MLAAAQRVALYQKRQKRRKGGPWEASVFVKVRDGGGSDWGTGVGKEKKLTGLDTEVITLG